MCKIKQLKPNYINIKINGQKPQDKKIAINAIRFKINQEIKFFYRKGSDFKCFYVKFYISAFVG